MLGKILNCPDCNITLSYDPNTIKLHEDTTYDITTTWLTMTGQCKQCLKLYTIELVPSQVKEPEHHEQ
jgi:hypothetical protein